MAVEHGVIATDHHSHSVDAIGERILQGVGHSAVSACTGDATHEIRRRYEADRYYVRNIH